MSMSNRQLVFYENHYTIAKSIMKRQLECEYCNLTFKSIGFLNRHKKIVHGVVISEEKLSPKMKYQ